MSTSMMRMAAGSVMAVMMLTLSGCAGDSNVHEARGNADERITTPHAAPVPLRNREEGSPRVPQAELRAQQVMYVQRYKSGLLVEVTLQDGAVLLNELPEQPKMTGLSLEAGAISVAAASVPPFVEDGLPQAQPRELAPRFWRLIRRKRISIGTTAKMTKFGVESLSGSPNDPVTKVTVMPGHEVEVESDDGLWYKLKEEDKWLEISEVGATESKFMLMPDKVEVGKGTPPAPGAR